MTQPAPDTAIVLAGGFGTRLRSCVSDKPKPLAPTGDRPFLTRLLDWLEQQGIRKAILAVHHMADQIIAYAQDYQGPLDLLCVEETEPLGTGGAIKKAFVTSECRGDVLVINGDTLFAFALAPFAATHAQNGGGATMVVCPVPDIARFGSVVVQEDRITGFLQATGDHRPGWSNCGAYLLAAETIASMPDGAFSIERDFFPQLAADGKLYAHCVSEAEAFIDIGTPESYQEFCRSVT